MNLKDELLQKKSFGVNVLYYGLRRAVEVASADNDEGDKIVISSELILSEDVTIPSNVNIHFTNKGKINVQSGYTLTINGTIFSEGGEDFIGNGTVNISNAKIISAGNNNVAIFGAVGDGVTDDTEALQKAIDSVSINGGTITLEPNKTYMIDADISLKMGSNITLIIPQTTMIKAIPTDSTGYEIIRVWDCENVAIKGGGTIQGDRDEHLGVTGEWGMGIDIRGSSNITIDNINVIDCWGDGIYIGITTNQNYCYNTKINGCTFDNNRRQGLSIISAIDMFITNSIFKNTIGTLPEAGIDFEPNYSTEYLKNINVSNCTFENNNRQAILFYLQNLTNSSEEVSINIDNCTDFESYNAVLVNSKPSIDIVNININNFKSFRSVQASYVFWDTSKNCNIVLKDILAKDGNTGEGTGETTSGGIIIIRDSTNDSAYATGGVTLDGVTVEGSNYNTAIMVHDRRSLINVENVNIKNVRKAEGTLEANSVYLRKCKNITFEDKFQATKKYITSGTFATYGTRLHYVYSSFGASENIVLNLGNDSDWGNGIEFTCINEGNYNFRIDSNSIAILPLQTVAGNYIETVEKGAQITLKKENDIWTVKNVVGTWTAQ